jgi:hypothetical protein
MDQVDKKLKISFMPCSNMRGASSRIRVYFIAAALRAQGYQVEVSRAPTDPDVLVIQKRIDSVTLAAAKSVRARGGRVIYDLDDFGPGLEWLRIDPNVEREMLSVVDTLVVDTDERLAFCAASEIYKDIALKVVIPNCLDYFPWLSRPIEKRPIRGGSKPKVVWFGNAINFEPASRYLAQAVGAGAVECVDVFTNQNLISDFKLQFPGMAFYGWGLESFPRVLGNYDCSVLIHDAKIEGQLKNNNKMLVSLAAGVIPFVSDTPSYRRTAGEIGCPELVVSSAPELIDRLLSSSSMSSFRSAIASPQVREYLNRVSPQVIAQKLINFIRSTPYG